MVMVKNLHSKGTYRHDKIIVKKIGIVLATFHDNIGIVMVKNLHSKGTCRHDKNIVKKNWHSTEELATFHDNIGIVMVKTLHSKGTCRHDKNSVKKIGIVLRNLPRSMTI